MNAWAFIALGVPAPQGSKRGFVNKKTGGVIITDTSKRLAPWRQTVAAAGAGAGPCLDGPVAVCMGLTMPRPSSARKKDIYPSTQPDIDKLVRAVFDGISDAGLWKDDGRVSYMEVCKLWPETVVGGLETPGVTVAAIEMEGEWLSPLRDLFAQTLDLRQLRHAAES